MSRDYLNQAVNAVRRSDRAISDDDWIRDFLCHAPIGVLATVYDDQPFINTNLFVYDQARHVIYMHTARVGRTQANVENHERVCFSINEMGRLLPAAEALEFSVEYAGVVIFGRASIVTDTGHAKYALQMLLDKYAPHLKPGLDYRPSSDDEVARTAVYQITIESWSGKRKQVAPDFPGAFYYASAKEFTT